MSICVCQSVCMMVFSSFFIAFINRLIGEVVDHLDALIEEWYPGLLIADPYGVCPLEKLTPCPDCKG